MRNRNKAKQSCLFIRVARLRRWKCAFQKIDQWKMRKKQELEMIIPIPKRNKPFASWNTTLVIIRSLLGGHPTGSGENCRKRQALGFHEHQGTSVLYPFILLFLFTVPIKFNNNSVQASTQHRNHLDGLVPRRTVPTLVDQIVTNA